MAAESSHHRGHAPHRDALVRIGRSQRRLLGLINDVLNLARIEMGRVEYAIEDVALADVVAGLTPMIEPQIAAKGLTYAAHLPPAPVIRLVCIDVDGTLVGSAGIVDPAVWRAAARARAAGIRLAICSGRPAFGLAREYADRLDGAGWHSFQNGASVLHLPTGRSRSARLEEGTVAMLVARARATGRLLELYADDDYAFHGDAELARAHAALLGVPFDPRPLEALAGPVIRAQWLVPRAALAAVIGEAHPGLEVSPSTSPLMPGTHFVNLTPAGVDKATAVRAIAEEYGVALDDVMFVGDGANDSVAMRVVGHPVAMGNADAEARDAARCSVAHVDEGGLTQALELALAA